MFLKKEKKKDMKLFFTVIEKWKIHPLKNNQNNGKKEMRNVLI